jgi:thiamine kinase-like enzyme
VYNFGVVMTEEEKKLLSTFEARLRHLIYLHDELKRENAELKELLKAKKEQNEKVLAEYKELKTNYTNLKTATTISLNGSDVKETKLRLSKLVREVDKCIALLNE